MNSTVKAKVVEINTGNHYICEVEELGDRLYAVVTPENLDNAGYQYFGLQDEVIKAVVERFDIICQVE